ncbi:hypothetical protein J1N35_041672 [Gossypium stocksii]|uniref:Uncharacterized protein n=1 Tax=Gossypium stocksii TaxID=47602 RepID=A0A9D3ZJX6_9ROSI|nr:hypothetical protein J1N35_041672 [Gossypium stocksii]
MNWLRRNFNRLDEDSIKVQREQHTRGHIFMITEGFLMPDKSRNIVQLRWLLKLIDFREVGELSSGSSMLETLYREMCQETTKKNQNRRLHGTTAILSNYCVNISFQ